jgi:hypothetical protein
MKSSKYNNSYNHPPGPSWGQTYGFHLNNNQMNRNNYSNNNQLGNNGGQGFQGGAKRPRQGYKGGNYSENFQNKQEGSHHSGKKGNHNK